MRVLIHQPHFLPWLPYVARLLTVDQVVFLDDAQYQEGYFHNRAIFVSTSSKAHWVTVPVRGGHGCSLAVAQACEAGRLSKAASFIDNTYARSASPILRSRLSEALRAADGTSLAALNIALMERVIEELGVRPINFIRSSSLSLPEDRTDRLVEICRAVGANALVNGWGKFASEHDLVRIKGAGLRLFAQDKTMTFAALASLQPRLDGLSIAHDIFRHGSERVANVIGVINAEAYSRI